MKKDIKLPEIAENVESGTVLEILVSEGDQVQKEDPLVELETDKATFEVPAEFAGTVKNIQVSEGDDVSVGQVILTLDTEEENGQEQEDKEDKKEKQEEQKEEVAEKKDEKDKKEEKEETEKKDEQDEQVEEKEEATEKEKEKSKETSEKQEPDEKEEEEKESTEVEEKEEVPAAPSVRRLAREIGVNIYQVNGSGPGGRITQEDVKEMARKGGAQKESKQTGQASTKSLELPDFSKWGNVTRESMSKIRQITADNMVQSWTTIPHVTQYDEAEISKVNEFTEQYAKQAEKVGGKLTVTAIILKLTASALQAFPRFNASLDIQNKEIIYKDYIHIGIAVDTEYGLLVPVIKDVNKKSVFSLSAELGEVAKKARDRKLSPDEMEGGNFSISNLGGIGGTNFTPLIYHPQVAILGVSKTEQKPVWNGQKFEPKPVIPLSLSYDHRIIDGATGARFLRWLCNAMEDPFLALMQGGE